METDNLNLNIVVVEDDQLVVHDLVASLTKLGYNPVKVFSCGEDLLSYLKKANPDIILVDIELGGELDGIQTATQVRQLRNIPCIFLTSFSDSDTVKKILKLEPYGYILKPTNNEQLRIAIDIAYYKCISDKKLLESEHRYHSIVENLAQMICRFMPDGTVNFANGNFIDYFAYILPPGESFFTLIENGSYSILRIIIRKISFLTPIIMSEFKVDDSPNGPVWQRWICQGLYTGHELTEYQFICEDVTERKESELEIQNTTLLLNQKIRELNCLYTISRYLEESDDADSFSNVLVKITNAISKALVRIKTAVCIEYGDRNIYSDNLFESSAQYVNSIIVNGSVVGTISLLFQQTEENNTNELLNKEEVDLVSAASELIGKTVAKIEAARELRRLEREIIMISERERQSLGQELHDSLGQILTGVAFLLSSAQKKSEKNPSVCDQELSSAVSLVREATVQCRQLSKGLVMPSGVDYKLPLMVEQLVNTTRQLYGITCEFTHDGSLSTNSFETLQIYRIIQESINNAIKHANASSITVRALRRDTMIEIMVSDNGSGFTRKSDGEGLGLNIMKYRADMIGAAFTIESDTSGTLIRLVFRPAGGL